jgi:hypothetical protein
MSSGRTTHDKRQRERAKQAKAAEKRARRQGRSSEEDADVTVVDGDDRSTEELLAEMEQLHASFDAKQIDFETFEERKNELLDRIAVRLAAGN